MTRIVIVFEIDEEPPVPAKMVAEDIAEAWEAHRLEINADPAFDEIIPELILIAAAWEPVNYGNDAEIEKVNRAWDTLGLA